MKVRYSNNASAALAVAVEIGHTQLTVTDASSFPSLAEGDWMYVTVGEEVVKVVGTSGSVFTCESFFNSHSIGTLVQGRITTNVLDSAQDIDVYTAPGDLPANGTVRLGETWGNVTDGVFGVGDESGNPLKLIAVTIHSSTARYYVNDMVVYLGSIYSCISAHTGSTFNLTNWKILNLPSQIENSGKFLTTDGSNLLWSDAESPNLILNGGFQSWVRATNVSDAVNGYTSADCWYNHTDGALLNINRHISGGIDTNVNAISIQANGGDYYYAGIKQGIELPSYNYFENKTITCSFDIRPILTGTLANFEAAFVDDVGSDSFKVDLHSETSPELTMNTWQRVSFTFTISASAYANNKALEVLIGVYNPTGLLSTWPFELANIKVEESASPTLFVMPNITDELLRCQRFIRRRSVSGIADLDLIPTMFKTPEITADSGNYLYAAEI